MVLKESLVKRGCFLLFLMGAFLPTANAADVVISQVFGGNGNTYSRDYVELFNKSANAVDISGWSIQYASATGAGHFAANGVTTLSGTLKPGQYYLVALGATSSTGTTLSSADFSGSVSTNLSSSNGKVVLVNTSTGLACNGGSTVCNATQTAQIIDLVGYGTANYFETSPAPALTTTTSLLRAASGCADTENNATDFSVGTPVPRNSSTTLNVCGGGGNVNAAIIPSCGNVSVNVGSEGSLALNASDADSIVTQASIISTAVSGISLNGFTAATADGGSASATLQIASNVAAGNYPVQIRFENNEAQSAVCTANVSVLAPVAATPIFTIQGTGSASSLNGSAITTEGIVTAVFPGLNGFYLQDETGDSNGDTSDGIFVYMGSGVTPTVSVGQKIRLNANVTEFNTVTELISPSNIQILSSANTVTPLDILLPEVNEGDLEAYEGMLVRIISPMTVSQNYFQGRYGQVSLSAEGRMIKPTNIYRPNTQEVIDLADENARRRITLDDGSSAQNPNPIPFIEQDNTLRAGDIALTITGVIDHGLITASSSGPRDYKIHATVTPKFARSNPRTAVPEAVGGNLKVASFNVLNYFTTFTNGQTASGQTGQGCTLGASVAASNCRGANNAAEFTRQRDKIINAIAAINADVVGLMEIQNNGAVAVQNLVDGLNANMGAGTYARVNDPATGMGTDAIKVAMIYKPANLSPFGVALSDTNSINNRPTLAQTFATSNGEKFSVLVNHFKSKSCTDAAGADLDQNDGQGCYNDRREKQAAQLATFINTVKSTAGDDDVLVIGDLNAYGKEDPVDALAMNGYTDQIARFSGLEGYSYVFDGEAGYLDHALANASMAAQISNVGHWHINADEPFVIDYNTEFKQPLCSSCSQDLYTSEPYKSSDHDPVIIGLNLQKPYGGTSGRDTIVGSSGDDVITGGLGSDVLTGAAGTDTFVFNSMREATDTINDFTPAVDRIQITNLLKTLGYAGTNPFADGYARVVVIGGAANLQIDSDGAGIAPYRTLAILKAVNIANIDVARDFVW